MAILSKYWVFRIKIYIFLKMYINFHLTNKVLEDGAYCVVKLSLLYLCIWQMLLSKMTDPLLIWQPQWVRTHWKWMISSVICHKQWKGVLSAGWEWDLARVKRDSETGQKWGGRWRHDSNGDKEWDKVRVEEESEIRQESKWSFSFLIAQCLLNLSRLW